MDRETFVSVDERYSGPWLHHDGGDCPCPDAPECQVKTPNGDILIWENPGEKNWRDAAKWNGHSSRNKDKSRVLFPRHDIIAWRLPK